MTRTNTQYQIITYLQANPGSTIRQIRDAFNKSRDVVCGAMECLETKGMCKRVELINRAWTYVITDEVITFQGITPKIAKKEKPPVKKLTDFNNFGKITSVAMAYKPMPYSVYKMTPWLSARPGADDHKAFKTRGF